jgi:hypothetical protein
MTNATQARLATEARIHVLAKEFRINRVEPKIQAAIDEGYFFCTVSLTPLDYDLPNPKNVGPELVNILEGEGFKAAFSYCDNGPRLEAYVTLDWREEDK